MIGVVPDDWKQVPLGDICEVTAGPSGAIMGHVSSDSHGVPVVRPKDIRNNRISMCDLKRIDEDSVARLARYRLTAGDVVCVRTGEPGRHGTVMSEQTGWLFGTACLRLHPADTVTGNYLAHYLDHPRVLDWLDRNSTGSAIRSLNAGVLARLPVVLPPVVVRRRIGDVLDSLDAKVEIHDKISRTTSRLRRSLIPLLLAGSIPVQEK